MGAVLCQPSAFSQRSTCRFALFQTSAESACGRHFPSSTHLSQPCLRRKDLTRHARPQDGRFQNNNASIAQSEPRPRPRRIIATTQTDFEHQLMTDRKTDRQSKTPGRRSSVCYTRTVYNAHTNCVHCTTIFVNSTPTNSGTELHSMITFHLANVPCRT